MKVMIGVMSVVWLKINKTKTMPINKLVGEEEGGEEEGGEEKEEKEGGEEKEEKEGGEEKEEEEEV